MSQKPAAPKRKAKKGGGGGAEGGEYQKKSKERSFDMSEAYDEFEESEESEVGLMQYTQLRLSSPQSAQDRGRLLPINTEETYLQSLHQTQQTLKYKLHIHFDVLLEVRRIRELALAHDNRSLPSGVTDVKDAAGFFDYTYHTDATVDVPSDGHPHSVPVGNREAPCDMHYVVVPREDTNVFRIADLTNPMHAPLLPGPAEIYVGDEYILSTQLPTVSSRGQFQLWLGVEQAIKCARNTRFKETRSGEKVVAMTELHHEIDIELVNRLTREIRCEVRERIPQPAEDAEVVVEEIAIEPEWQSYNQEERQTKIKGGRRWEVTIPSGQTTNLKAEYVIKIYANNELTGGNRREA